MAILAFAHHQDWEIYLSNAIMGVGFGLAFSAMSALVVAAVPPSQTGVASGMNANIRTIGGSIGAAVMASIVTSQLGPSGLPGGVRLHDRVRGDGRRAGAGRARRAADPGARGPRRLAGEPEHAELAAVATGTVAVEQRLSDPGPPGADGEPGARAKERREQSGATARYARAPARRDRRDAVRNYHRILDAARDVLGESGADASMEEIAARAGVGVGTVYRRFASKDALIDELLRLALDEILSSTDQALARTDGHGLEELLRALGRSFADHARYASLLLQRPTDAATSRRMRAAIEVLTARAVAAGTINPGITVGDVMALIWAMRGLVQATGEVAPGAWQRFLDIQLAGMRAAGPLSGAPPMSARQLSKLAPRR